MGKIKLHKDFLKNELHLPDKSIKDTITGNSRWSINHEIIFAHDGKFYKTWYSEGATEMQDESPWEYDSDVDCVEVKIIEKTVKIWEEL